MRSSEKTERDRCDASFIKKASCFIEENSASHSSVVGVEVKVCSRLGISPRQEARESGSSL